MPCERKGHRKSNRFSSVAPRTSSPPPTQNLMSHNSQRTSHHARGPGLPLRTSKRIARASAISASLSAAIFATLKLFSGCCIQMSTNAVAKETHALPQRSAFEACTSLDHHLHRAVEGRCISCSDSIPDSGFRCVLLCACHHIRGL